MADTFPNFDDFNDYGKPFQHSQQQPPQQSFDNFYSFQSPDVAAPHPDLFDSELDNSLAGIDEHQLQLLSVDNHDAFNYLRSDTPTHGPPSSIASESAYDSISSYSGSYYNTTPSNYSIPLDLELEFRRIAVESNPGFSTAPGTAPLNELDTLDPSAFSGLPATPPLSPPTAGSNLYDRALSGHHRSSYSDYGMSGRSTGASAGRYYDPLAWRGPAAAHHAQSTVAPGNINGNGQTPVVPSITMSTLHEGHRSKDPHKKYACTVCPRSFARAYNLKTHMATHDPNRPKPHICPHRSCGRSFSRKHDLGRHLISIHRDESVASSTHSAHSANSKRSIGVDNQSRSWCETCGKGFVGRKADCDCADAS